ncbi:hypothetical protein SPRG_12904 [Saprolegnia parasitica CBS 223.65]|uniref:Transmembrane protein n=1 Tax=Saprolegnia parasitica (strain CBS 223.65) TaxID=695850 RepID=A0A067BS92_SAPPC|nr:hypothetical protein SPRG_12904 [Saprolegnia parasitica CBS 223.65]KDO21123.1 hypothetical protein SPRG_12904 [Saprolegnia parasitica CBS 223.65]|eukprot:XP_012208124.1 hypothetical protein SPRG_12904 [Saprolegnia parasitica CBS 223.65]
MVTSPTPAILASVRREHWRFQLRKWYQVIVTVAGFCVILLIAGDATANNWAIGNFLGGGYFFLTPIASVQSLAQLRAKYSFATNLGVDNLSNLGQWMSNFSVVHMVTKSDKIYVIQTGDIPLTPDSVLCPIFESTYAVDVAVSSKVKLALLSDAVTFFRGNAMTHFFSDDTTANLGNSSMTSDELIDRNYIPGRTTVDKRFTTEIALLNSSVPQTHRVNYYRIFSRSFCSGCDPVAELGYSVCNMTMVYNDTTKTLTVTSSRFLPGSNYKLGFIMPNSAFGQVALAAKITAIVFAVFGYLASRRTVQWHDVDPTKAESVLTRAVRTVLPKVFRHQSHALRFDMFCYNSDIFVFLYAASVLIDIPNCLLYMRNVNLYTMYAPQFLYSLQLFSLSTRLLWVNCAILKGCKILWNLLGVATFNGESVVMRFFNWSSVKTLYASAVLLFYVPPFIEYNNSITVDVRNAVRRIDGICVNVFDGFYMRVASSITIGLIANVLLLTALDHVIFSKFWRVMTKNSLARQAIFNSSSILCDYLDDVTPDTSVIIVTARRLSTLQWFFTSHLVCFGLPEKGLRANKSKAVTVKAPQTSPHKPLLSSLSAVAPDESAAATGDTGCRVVQDGDRNLYLLDHKYTAITSLAFNIKILKNTTITIQ